MNNLQHVDAELTEANSVSPHIIAHVCNENGIWSGDVANAIARKWPQARRAYLEAYRNRMRGEFGFGSVQFVNAQRPHTNQIIRIANMIAQPAPQRPVRYRALRKCLIAVGNKAIKIRATVHLPKLGADQTDSWPDIELIIYNTLCTASISVFVYQPQVSNDNELFGEATKKHDRETGAFRNVRDSSFPEQQF